MTIKRTINGIEYGFELTREELLSAYYEVQQGYDEDDVTDYIPVFLSDNEDYTEEQIMEKLPEIAAEYRRGLNCLDWWDCARCAVLDCLRED